MNQIVIRVNDPGLQERLELAVKLGVNVSESVRELLPAALDKKIKQKTKEMRELLETVPA